MFKNITHLANKFIRDRKGNVAIWQFPNVPLWSWIVFTAASMVVKHGKAHAGLHLLAQAALFTWAYLEVSSGVSPFRRILGAVVLVSTAAAFFMQ